MNSKHTIMLREAAKFLTGLVFADILVGIWFGAGHGYGSVFFGFPITEPLINMWIVIDAALILLLAHYGWHIKLPASPSRRVFYIAVGGILSAVAVLHFVRIILSIPVVIGGLTIPFWLSVFGAIVAGFLAYSSFHFAGRR